jgi:hypothetical protein
MMLRRRAAPGLLSGRASRPASSGGEEGRGEELLPHGFAGSFTSAFGFSSVPAALSAESKKA